MTLTISPSGSVGVPVGEVQFSVDSSDPLVIESYSWTFGDGATPNTSTEATPTVQLGDPGTYTVSLSIVDDQLQTHLAGGEFTVTSPVAPTWTVQELGPTIGSDPAFYNRPHSIVTGLIYDGKLVLAYTAPGGLTIRRALVELPEDPEDWAEHVIDAEGFVAGVHTLTVHKGKLALLYQRRFGLPDNYPEGGIKMCLASATEAEPESPEDWSIHEIEFGESQGMVFSSLASIDDEYLVGLTNRGGIRLLVSNEEPAAAEDWTLYSIPEEWPFLRGEFMGRVIRRDGALYVATTVGYPTKNENSYGVDFFWTTTSPPMGPADWQHSQVKPGIGDGSNVTLWPAGEGWALAVRADSRPDNTVRVYHTALLEPDGIGSWQELALEGPNPASSGPGAAVISGRAVVAYFDNNNQQLRIARQVTTGIAQMHDWKRTSVTDVVGDEHAFWVAPLILELDGRIAIFWCEPVSRRLRFALADTAY